MSYDCCLIQIFAQSAAESCHFPQPAQLSAALLLKSTLQVSTGESGHMGKLQIMWTWNVSLWFSRITHKRPWSRTVKAVVNLRVLWWQDSVFHHVKTCVANSSILGGVLTPVDQSVNQIEQPPLHRFICHGYHTPRSQDVEIYVSVWQRRIQESVIASSVINNVLSYAYQLA